MDRSFLITHLKGIWLAPNQSEPLKLDDLQSQFLLSNSWLHIQSGKIHGYGLMQNLDNELNNSIPEGTERIDGSGRYVLPSWVDAHTHLVFAAWRENEMEMRNAGKSYLEIAASGGGILNSAARLEKCDEQNLFDSALERLHSVIGMGTGAIEIKSGYGLSLESELKMLRVIRRLKEVSPIPIKSTFLGAHAIPKTYSDRNDYINLVINEMIPNVAAENLADYCDVFCDTGFFTPEESLRILEQGIKYGLKPKLHANELARSGGVQIGTQVGAISVDHLECVEEEELDCLAKCATIPVLLPGTAFFLGIHPPPARKMIGRGLPVALSTDYNPGTCPSGNMELVVSMGCTMLKMQATEAIHAATVNASYAMEVENECGKILPGRDANVLLTKKIPSPEYIPYHFGESAIDAIFVKGERF